MKKNFNEKQQRFSFRKLSVGLVSATVASLFFMTSIATAQGVGAQSIQLTYVTEQELTEHEKNAIVYDVPGKVEKTDATYYLVYRPALSSSIWQTEDDSTASSVFFETNQSIITPLVQKSVEKAQASPHGLPKTGVFDNLLLGMAGIFTLVLAIKVSKKGKKELASVILLTATGASFLAPTSHAISSQILAKFNHAIEIAEGQSLPVPNDIEGYVYVGYLKESKEEVDQTAEAPVITEKPDTAPTHSLPEAKISEKFVTEDEDIPFEKVTIYSSALMAGEQKVTQAGQVGKQVTESKQTYVNGQLVKTEKLSTKVISEPVEEITMIGTKDSDMNLSNSIDLPTLPIETQNITKTKDIPFETHEIENAALVEGETRVAQEGANGIQTITIQQTIVDGQVLKEEEISSEITKAAIPRVIEIGTKKSDETVITEVPDSAPTHQVPSIEISEEITSHVESIPFETQEVYDANLAEGVRQTVQIGQAGQRVIESKLTYAGGILLKSEIVSESLQAAIPQIIHIGTKSVSPMPEPEPIPEPVPPIENTGEIITEVPNDAPTYEVPAIQLTEDIISNVESIPYPTQEIMDPNLPEGTRQVVQVGQYGTRTTDTKLTYADGILIRTEILSDVTSQPIAEIIAIGTKIQEQDKITTEVEHTIIDIQFDTEYVDDPSLPLGQEQVQSNGVLGQKTLTTTYTLVNGVRQANPTVTGEITKQPISQIVARGTKVIEEKTEVETRTEEMPFDIVVRESDKLYLGEERVQVEGKVGSKEITTTYQTIKGVRQPNPTVTEKVLTEPVAKQVLKGTKPIEGTEVDKRTEEIAFETKEVPSADLYVGEEKVVTEGKVGTKEITTTYQTIKGVRQPNPVVTEKVFTEPVAKQVLKGTKPVEGTEVDKRTEEIAYETKEIPSADLYVGEEQVQVEGKVGTKEITTTYQTIKGVRQPNPTVTEKILAEPIAREILRGTKPVTAIEKDIKTEVLPFETKYIDDPSMLEGKTVVEKEGKDGLKTITTIYQTIRGVRQNPPLSIEELVDHPEDKIVRRGTKVEEIPTLTIIGLDKNEDNRSATASYKLDNPTDNYLRVIALLYKGEQLVEEKEITDANGNLEFTNLDFYTDYTLKTKVFYTLDSVEHNAIQESLREFNLFYKKIEVKDIDAVTVYRRKDGKYTSAYILDEIPANPDDIFVKVTSDRFKDIYLPISSVKETTKNGQPVYELTSTFDQLVEDNGTGFNQQKVFYIPKVTKENGVYTDFTSLLDAMKANPTGTFKLGANLYADEVQVGDVKAYMTDTFQGTLLGESNGNKYAIHNLKAPLFAKIERATISGIDLKNVQISSALHRDLGSLANETAYSTISDVAVQGNLRAQRNLGGIVYKLDYQSRLSNASFQGKLDSYGRGESYVGGIVGMNPGSYITDVKADVNISILGENNQAAGAIAGRVTGWQSGNEINIKNAYATGSVTNLGTSQKVGGMVGTNDRGWNYGSFDNLVSQVQVTGGQPVIGQVFEAATKLSNAFSTIAGENNTQITAQQAESKLSNMAITAKLTDSDYKDLNAYSVDYSNVTNAKTDHTVAYLNMEKILPFYNKELLVYYGNTIATTDKLNQVKLVDVVPMEDNAVVADLIADKASVNKIMLYFEDGTVDYKSVSYAEDFKNNHIIEYDIAGLHIPYTPESFVNQNEAMVNRLVDLLSPITYESEALLKQLNPPAQAANQTTNDINDMYFKSSFNRIKDNLSGYLRKVLTATMNGQGQSVETYFENKIANNKEAFLLGLSYLDRWYDINYDTLNTKELTLFNMDFFGNHSASTLDAIISIGQAGYEALRPKNNVELYSSYLAEMTGKSTVFDLVESYRKVFSPNKTDNQWFKDNTKAYIVEMKSQVPEALEKQNTATKHSKYAVEVYDKITNPSWRYRQMLLPLLTMENEDIYIISNMNTVAFGAFSRYRDLVNHPEKREEVYAIINQAAIWQRDHTDFWYKTLNDENKDKMFGAYMNTDGFGLFDENGTRVWHNLSSSNAAIQDFFGPIAKWYGSNGTAAYANGSETHFVAYLMLDKVGSSTYTHEMVHNLDSNTFFYGFGRRTGQGPELYARGLLQNVSNTEDNIIALNTMYTEMDKKDSLIRVQPYNPVERFNSQEDLNTYAHHMFDAIYMLDYLEGSVVLQQDAAVKKAWFRKIENYYDGVHAGNQIRPLTDEEVAKLVTFDDLIDQSIMNRRQYSDNEKLARNGYYNTFLLSPIYSALDNPTGAPGDVMFRRMAYELLAAKGYDEGFVPYVSNQLKSVSPNGIVTDTVVLQHVFNNKYATWSEFKKDMYKERIDQLTKLKPITIVYELGKPNSTNIVTINSYQDLENLMKAAVEEDMKRLDRATSNVNTSWVHSLKRKVYSELLRSTDEFRNSIFYP
ncbi:ZmpA/ZmpB/ZmpC family metallo-endopeptidase [Streptococcus suis]|uniref:ZmpA/ZmpB/ZmpC family metallo-endopeptidase n=1 Tax=Streptococcus suis TaxID=1307 RepID=UPI0013DA42A7|nr:ZmpA/ZmpB/ZmpC family metallo-endopeptidase [Streptococcus suis]MBY4971522.1 G5 domain-containing protein [Streptococcus suis]MBY4982626.1 G5 domain-containing protein [Streptococcus suis]MBY4993316.1 G5 domain-containing protein [Streptococcus suis]MBY5002196.1 G5 domain-containing protein [Streptococcus suis]MBY5008779.1 G5 domain-containing protein [Streptococcus suis]